jgi:hypothetical protein
VQDRFEHDEKLSPLRGDYQLLERCAMVLSHLYVEGRTVP